MEDYIFSFNDTSWYLGQWETILDEYGDSVCAEEFWLTAREFSTLPHFGNLYQESVIQKLITLFCAELDIVQDSNIIKFDYYINAIDTHFYINDREICDTDDWYEILDEVREEILEAVKLAA